MHSAAVLERVHDALLSCVNGPRGRAPDAVRAAITPFMVALCSGIVKASSLRSDAAKAMVSGDEDALRQLLWILLDNAFHCADASWRYVFRQEGLATLRCNSSATSALRTAVVQYFVSSQLHKHRHRERAIARRGSITAGRPDERFA